MTLAASLRGRKKSSWKQEEGRAGSDVLWQMCQLLLSVLLLMETCRQLSSMTAQ